jgi:hypothetical protein
MSVIFRLVLPLLALLLPGLAAAQPLGDARVAYSADRTLQLDDRTYEGKVYAKPGLQRHEQEIGGMQHVFLLRGSDARAFLVVPSVHSYVEFGIAPALAELSAPTIRGTAVGQDTVSGVRTTKYRVEYTARDNTFVEGWLWLSADQIPMKAEGTYTKGNGGKPIAFRMQLSNVRIAAQQQSLFDIPQGFVKLPTAALQGLLGVGRS